MPRWLSSRRLNTLVNHELTFVLSLALKERGPPSGDSSRPPRRPCVLRGSDLGAVVPQASAAGGSFAERRRVNRSPGQSNIQGRPLQTKLNGPSGGSGHSQKDC